MNTRCVYKYPLSGSRGRLQLSLPRHARVLSFGEQDGLLMIWASVDPREIPEPREFLLLFTGQAFDAVPGDSFVGTTTTPDGLVWHLFEATA